MAGTSALLRSSSRLVRSMTGLQKPLVMSPTKSFSMLAGLTPRLATISPSMTRLMATKSDQDLGKFLVEEMATEKKNQRSLPKLEGWKVKTDGSEITLTRDVAGGEQVMVTLNVNHTVDSAQPDDGSEEVGGLLQLCIYFGNNSPVTFHEEQ